jgi:malate/lactate dehydrogenase
VVAKPDCFVIVVFNPVNMNTMILNKYCKKIPAKNYVSMV